MKTTRILSLAGTLIIALGISACAGKARRPSSLPVPPSLKNSNLREATQTILSDVKSSDFGDELCVSYMKALEKEIDGIDVSNFAGKLTDKEDLKDIAELSWEIRSTLHNKLSLFNESCTSQIQTNFRQLRFIEEYFMERYLQITDLTPAELDFQAQPVPMLEEQPYYLTYGGNSFKPQPGDILVSRGLSYLSAMIARLGKRWAQFSHIVFLGEDPKDKQMKSIEALVGAGVRFYDMPYALKNENARILWIRPKDRDLGRRAAEFMARKVRDRLDAGDPIKYDYKLDFTEHSVMSCAEVAQTAYELAPGGGMKIPMYPNKIEGAEPLLEHIGLTKGETFEPGDMEIDPRFEIMAEFRDLRLTRDSRQKDVVLTEMFRWMDELGYDLIDSGKSKAAGGVIYTMRRTFLWPLIRKVIGVDNFSKEIPRKMLRTVTLLNQIGEQLLAEIKAKDMEKQKLTGWPMTYLELYKEIEDYRKKDLLLYSSKSTRKQSTFHRWFKPVSR